MRPSVFVVGNFRHLVYDDSLDVSQSRLRRDNPSRVSLTSGGTEISRLPVGPRERTHYNSSSCHRESPLGFTRVYPPLKLGLYFVTWLFRDDFT